MSGHFFNVVVNDLTREPRLAGICANFEMGEWRMTQLVKLVFRALPDFCLRYSEQKEMSSENAMELIAAAAKRVYRNIVIVVPTLALLDETRRRLTQYSDQYKIITHSTQNPAERNIFVHTQERVVDNEHIQNADFFVIDEFYKLDPVEDSERAQTLNLAFHNRCVRQRSLKHR